MGSSNSCRTPSSVREERKISWSGWGVTRARSPWFVPQMIAYPGTMAELIRRWPPAQSECSPKRQTLPGNEYLETHSRSSHMPLRPEEETECGCKEGVSRPVGNRLCRGIARVREMRPCGHEETRQACALNSLPSHSDEDRSSIAPSS